MYCLASFFCGLLGFYMMVNFAIFVFCIYFLNPKADSALHLVLNIDGAHQHLAIEATSIIVISSEKKFVEILTDTKLTILDNRQKR
jgi:hypothetical protein